jgi:hypothetical protein
MIHRRISASGLFLVLLALMAQLALVAVEPRSLVNSALNANTSICHVGGQSDEAPTPRDLADCLLCPLRVSLTDNSFTLPVEQTAPPDRGTLVAREAIPPQAPAPPDAIAARPRGPPFLL